MPNNSDPTQHELVAAWAKRCYLAGRSAMESLLRPFNLGATQWFVLHHLAAAPTMQRDLVRLLQVDRATLSPIIAALVRRGFVEQIPDQVDHRQKRLRLTASGADLWAQLPDLKAIQTTAFGGLAPNHLSVAIDVLRTATERLEDFSRKGIQP